MSTLRKINRKDLEPFSPLCVSLKRDMIFPPIVPANCPAVTPPTARQIDIARWIPSTQRAIFRSTISDQAVHKCMTHLRILHCTIQSIAPILGSEIKSGWNKIARHRRMKKMVSMKQSFQNWRRYRSTCSELSRMSDRELSDIGIARSDIPFVARRAV